MANVLLFTGVETFGWQLSVFDTAIQWCKNHRIDGLIVKVYEVTQGEWYMGLGGSSVVVNHIRASGLDCLPYGYYYWVSPSELASISFFLAKHGKYCLNLEAEWDGNPNNMIGTLATALSNHPGDLWVSPWANPAEHGWLDNIRTLDPFVSVWMPEEYNDSLTTKRLSQFPTVQGKVCPTYKVNSLTITRMIQKDTPSLWEYMDALQQPALVDEATAQIKAGGNIVQLNGNGCVCDTTRWYQLETEQLPNVPGSPPGTLESQDLCGPGGVIITALSNVPNGGRLKLAGVEVDAAYIDRATDDMADAWGKAHGQPFNHVTWLGSDDNDMIWFLNYARDKYQRTHYQVIASPTIDKIRTAVRAGYPALFSCNELDIQEKRTGARPPYPWKISAGHIIAVTGIDKDGDFICPDILNDGFQNTWPVTYVANTLAHSLSWACIIKLPFLANIPSGDPLGSEWKNFNAQNFGGIQPMNWPSQGMQQQAQDTWLISAKFLQAAFASTAPYTTGIALAWQDKYKQGKNYGPPVCTEINSVDWNNKPVKVQLFAAGVRAEWDGTCHWFDKDGPLS